MKNKNRIWIYQLLILGLLLILINSCKKVDEPAELADLTTMEVTEITATSATSGGNIIADGGSSVTAKGVCWNTSPVMHNSLSVRWDSMIIHAAIAMIV